MPLFTPGSRWQPAFYPFKRVPFLQSWLTFLERIIKGPLFGCRMCGNCLLQETAFICPMECPKGLRNGPCGGSTPDHCYVDESRPCIWYAIYERSIKFGSEYKLLEVQPPLDWDKVGTDTWSGVFFQVKKIGYRGVTRGLLNMQPTVRYQTWENIFKPIRQPDWWQGDGNYHPPMSLEPISTLQKRLMAGGFVVTAEVAPPLSVSTRKLITNLDLIRPFVTAVNFTDNPSATPRMSSWACAGLAVNKNIEPVMQIAARDKTRIGFQSEILGANALGINNFLCISGDSMKLGPGPKGRMDVIDIDSIQMLWILRRMRDDRRYLDGREIKYPPKFFLGAAASPLASDVCFQALREQKKVNAGAQFFQTNVLFNLNKIDRWLDELNKRNVLDKVFILIGVTPLKSLKMAEYMDKMVPGVYVPDDVLRRLEIAENKGNAAEEGIQITLELIDKIKKLKGQGINGIHIMAVGWEEIVPRIVSESGLG